MRKTDRYLQYHFIQTFLTILLPFFMIVSLIYLIKIASLSSKIELGWIEMSKLYLYTMPEIVYYTVPISFVASASTSLSKLSQDNELLSLSALGIPIGYIVKTYFLIAIAFSFFLLVISFVAIPMSEQFYKAFIEAKKSEGKLQIKPGKLGQKFGNYHIYVKSEQDGIFMDVVIFGKDSYGKEQFFSSKYGKLHHSDMATSLELIQGYGYTYDKEKLQEAQYESLEIFDYPKSISFRFQDIVSYWMASSGNTHLQKKIVFNIFVSLIPILGIWYSFAFSVFNPRHQRSRSFFATLVTILAFYFIASYLQKNASLPLLIGSVCILLITGYAFYYKKVRRYF